MQEEQPTETKFHKVGSDAYTRKKLNINTITNTSQWTEDQWEDLNDMYEDDK